MPNKSKQRFDQLLQAMVTQRVSEKAASVGGLFS